MPTSTTTTTTTIPVTSSAAQILPSKPVAQATPVIRPWIPPQTQTDPKTAMRDPRLNRTGPPAPPQPKEVPLGKKVDAAPTKSASLTPEKSAGPDRNRTPRKEVLEEKSKSPSPLTKSLQNKNKHLETENQKSSDPKKDPRLKKRTSDKSNAKEDELKEKKRCTDKKEAEETARGGEMRRTSKGRVTNGSVNKQDRDSSADKDKDSKSGGNARTHARKRTRSRSRSRSPNISPKRKDRRSPKSRGRSTSLTPPPSHKLGKLRRVRADEPDHGKASRDERLAPKKNQSDSRRSKRTTQERHSEPRDSHSPRSHEGGNKDPKDAPHRWRSGWEENKQ